MKRSSALAAFAGVFVVTMLGLLAVGATLPVLPRYVKGPIGSTDLAVGIVTGAFAANRPRVPAPWPGTSRTPAGAGSR